MGMEGTSLEAIQEGGTMVRRNIENKEMSLEISEERRTSKSEKFERIFNF